MKKKKVSLFLIFAFSLIALPFFAVSAVADTDRGEEVVYASDIFGGTAAKAEYGGSYPIYANSEYGKKNNTDDLKASAYGITADKPHRLGNGIAQKLSDTDILPTQTEGTETGGIQNGTNGVTVPADGKGSADNAQTGGGANADSTQNNEETGATDESGDGAADESGNETADENGNGATDESGNETADESGNGENIFDSLYTAVTDNLDKILSSFAFIGSLLIAFTYKKGLLPAVNQSLSAIGGVVGNIKEQTEKGISSASENSEKITNELTNTQNLLNSIRERLESLETELNSASKTASEIDKFKSVLTAQTDMMYEIFMTSSLPQFQKDSIAGHIREIREKYLGVSPDE